MKAVHFGAGNIGRGFIGLLLSDSGYEVQFVDVNESLVSLLNEKREYTVTLANEKAETNLVRHVSAIDGKQVDLVAEAVAEADLVTTAVGVSVLKHIAEAIAKGIVLRLDRTAAPLHIIACENAIGGSTELKGLVFGHLSEENRKRAEGAIAFPDAAVDRIVPLQHHEDPLQVTVEPFYEWVVDGSAMLEGYRPVEGIHYVDDLQPYIERKLFTVNTGHCCAAYHGYLRGYATIQEAMKDDAIKAEVAGALRETGAALIKQYGLDEAGHARYIDKILERFRNPYLTDEVERVGRSPQRKLSPNDRLVRPALMAYGFGAEVPHLTTAMGAALAFDNADDPEAVELQASIREQGLGKTVAEVTGIPSGHALHEQICAAYELLVRRR